VSDKPGIQADSKVSSVIIYSDRALVTRTAKVTVEKESDLVFAGLPGSLDDQSIRVKAKGLTIGEIQIRMGYEKQPHPRVKEVEDKIKVLEIDDRKLADEYAITKEKEKFLSAIATSSATLITKEINSAQVSPQSWREGLKFIVEELTRSRTRVAEIERERADLKEKINAANQELNDIRADVEQRKAIYVCISLRDTVVSERDVHPEKAQAYEIELSYVIYGASWWTYYELRGNPAEKQLEISYFGKTRQRTGEDWDDTKLILSTGMPALGGVAPEPSPWYISLYRARPRGEAADYEAAAGSRAAAPAMKPKKEMTVEQAPPEPQPVEAGIAIWYPLPGKYTIKSGDQERKILIKKMPFEAEFSYSTLPRIAQLAYLTGKIKNTTDFLLLAGEGNTYVGDDFTGRVYVPTVVPDDFLTASLGADERVKVKRELKKMKVDKGGIFGSKTKHEMAYENSIENFHTKELTCKIVDQVPVPTDPSIKVSDVRFEPKPTEENKDQGIYTWKIVLQPKAKFTIKVSFSVEAPGEAEVQGLSA